MKEINETVEKLKDGSRSIRDDLKNDDMILTKELCRVIYEMGNIELLELGHISTTVQCHSCLKHVPEGLKFCGCFVCLRPDEDTMNRIKARFQALVSPYYVARVGSRGKKQGDQQWQQDLWKSIDAKQGARKNNNHPSIVSRWHNDEQYRNTQLANGWTETYCRYLDCLTTIDISQNAPYHQRSRFENTVTNEEQGSK